MMIRNLKHSGDYKKAVLTNEELLKIQAANNQTISLARKNANLGIPTEMPHHLTLSKTEQLQDTHSQLVAARTKLVEMGFASGEAAEITNALGDGDIIIMNQTFPGMRKMFEAVYSVKQATPKLFLNWFEKYAEELAASKGLSFGRVGKFDALTDNVTDMITIYPTRESIVRLTESWRDYATGDNPSDLEVQIYDTLKTITKYVPSIAEWNTLRSNSVENNILINQFQDAFRTVPTLDDILAAIKDETPSKQEKVLRILNAFTDNVIDKLALITKQIQTRARVIATSPVTTDGSFPTLLSPSAFKQANNTIKTRYLTSMHQHELFTQLELPIPPRQGAAYAVLYKELYKEESGKYQLKQQGVITGSGRKVIVGKGIERDDVPKYRPFGKYVIVWDQLVNNDILNVKYPSLGRVPQFPPVAISDVFKELIEDVLDSKKVNKRLYDDVPKEERVLFEKIVMGAGLMQVLGLKRTVIDTAAEDYERFNVLKGEWMAGNNSPTMVKELRQLIIKFMDSGRIPKSQGTKILLTLA